MRKWKRNLRLCIWHLLLWDGAFNYFKIERKLSNVGKPPFNLKYMIKLIFYGCINKITSSIELAYNAKYNIYV